MSKIVSLTNQKGGVGKTTTSVNLAVSFAVSEVKTLLIDLDPQSNATTGLEALVEDLITKTLPPSRQAPSQSNPSAGYSHE